jgi:hypothetical protein
LVALYLCGEGGEGNNVSFVRSKLHKKRGALVGIRCRTRRDEMDFTPEGRLAELRRRSSLTLSDAIEIGRLERAIEARDEEARKLGELQLAEPIPA